MVNEVQFKANMTSECAQTQNAGSRFIGFEFAQLAERLSTLINHFAISEMLWAESAHRRHLREWNLIERNDIRLKLIKALQAGNRDLAVYRRSSFYPSADRF